MMGNPGSTDKPQREEEDTDLPAENNHRQVVLEPSGQTDPPIGRLEENRTGIRLIDLARFPREGRTGMLRDHLGSPGNDRIRRLRQRCEERRGGHRHQRGEGSAGYHIADVGRLHEMSRHPEQGGSDRSLPDRVDQSPTQRQNRPVREQHQGHP